MTTNFRSNSNKLDEALREAVEEAQATGKTLTMDHLGYVFEITPESKAIKLQAEFKEWYKNNSSDSASIDFRPTV